MKAYGFFSAWLDPNLPGAIQIFDFYGLNRWGELPYYKKVCGPDADGIGIAGRTTLEGWLARWALHLSAMRRFSDLPLYLQYLCKILFHVVDRTSKYLINLTPSQ